jgi:hypothetical protein
MIVSVQQDSSIIFPISVQLFQLLFNILILKMYSRYFTPNNNNHLQSQ